MKWFDAKAMSGPSDFAVVLKAGSAIKKAEQGGRRILSAMVADTLALANGAYPRNQHRTRIVMVDDDNDGLELLASIIRLNFQDATVLTFKDGKTAWAELQRLAPDVLITDLERLRRPDPLDGWEMLRLLAAKHATYPILVVSAAWKGKVQSFLADLVTPLNVTHFEIPFEVEPFLAVLGASIGLLPAINSEQ